MLDQTLKPSGWAVQTAFSREIMLELDGMWRVFRLEFHVPEAVKFWADGDISVTALDDNGEAWYVLLQVEGVRDVRSYANLQVSIRYLCPETNVV